MIQSRFFLSFICGFAFALSQVWAADSCAVRVRDLATPRGLYVSNLAKPSLGVKAAELTPESIKAFFDSHPDLKDSQLYVVGVSLTGKDRSEFVKLTKRGLASERIEDVHVRPITKPKNAFERVLMQFPLREDWQRPTLKELTISGIFYTISNSTFTIIMLATQPAEIAVPVSIVNALQSASTTFPRQTIGNWLSRSPSFTEKLTKQLGLSFLFTLGLTLAKAGGVHGVEEGVLPILTATGMGAFVAEQWSKMAFQTSWRIPVESGIPSWVNQKTREGKEQQARAWGTFYRQLSTNIATPFWGYSAVSNHNLFHFLFDWNLGHLVMVGVGGVATAGWLMPKMYDKPMQLVSWIRNLATKPKSPEELEAIITREKALAERQDFIARNSQPQP